MHSRVQQLNFSFSQPRPGAHHHHVETCPKDYPMTSIPRPRLPATQQLCPRYHESLSWSTPKSSPFTIGTRPPSLPGERARPAPQSPPPLPPPASPASKENFESRSVHDGSRDILAATALPKFVNLRLRGDDSDLLSSPSARDSLPSLVATCREKRGQRARGQARERVYSRERTTIRVMDLPLHPDGGRGDRGGGLERVVEFIERMTLQLICGASMPPRLKHRPSRRRETCTPRPTKTNRFPHSYTRHSWDEQKYAHTHTHTYTGMTKTRPPEKNKGVSTGPSQQACIP